MNIMGMNIGEDKEEKEVVSDVQEEGFISCDLGLPILFGEEDSPQEDEVSGEKENDKKETDQ